MKDKKQRAIGELGALSRLLYAELLKLDVDEMVTYETLSAAIARDVQTESRHHLQKAREMALRFDNRVFDVVTDVGLKRVEQMAVVAIADRAVGHIARTAKRVIRKLDTVRFDELSQDELRKASVTRAQVGLARTFAIERTRRQLDALAADGGAMPEPQALVQQTLKAFRPP